MASLNQMANALRFLSVDMIEKAKSGHPGMPLGMADVAAVLWTKFMRFDSSNPCWFDRDRFVMSNGHGSALLYSLLYVLGYPDITIDDLKNFRQLDSKTAGHPESTLLPGIDYSTGPLGQGLGAAVGMALSERMLNARFGDELVNHKTYVFVGDGDLMEGISEEAISFAGHMGLNRLIVLWDDNGITIDGTTDIATSTHMKARFEANNWRVLSCNGHDYESIEKALNKAQQTDRPVLIDCKTTIGYGAPDKGGTPACHGSPLGATEIQKMRDQLNWPDAPFEIPEDILFSWKIVGIKGEGQRQQWEDRLKRSENLHTFKADVLGDIPNGFSKHMHVFKKEILSENKPMATRKSSQKVLGKLQKLIPNLIGGSADLTAANYTNTLDSVQVTKFNYKGNYIEYGIREHVMGAIMNGIAAHSGFIPYGGTFLSFIDYMKPAMRLAALMKLRVLYVLTHDSIGVGEDGPTHQPIEQLISLRATPNMLVFRPADAIEVAECYETAVAYECGPSALILSRQEVPLLRQHANDNLSANGAYILYEPLTPRQVTLIATGSEVALAMAAKDILAQHKIAAAVVSMPCQKLFMKQPEIYQQAVLGMVPRMAIEAGSTYGWDRFVGSTGIVLGIDRFGQSAPAKALFEKFGFTPQNVAEQAVFLVKGIKA